MGEPQSVVIDAGSGVCKAGFAGDDAPKVTFPSITGTQGSGDCYVGNAAQAKRDILTLKYPVERGIVTNWDDMEKIWHHTFHSELRVSPENLELVLLSEHTNNTNANREKMAQIMFEKLKAPALYIAPQPVLPMYAAGLSSGIVLDSGYGVTQISPVYNGYPVPDASMSTDIGGSDLSAYLQKMLTEKKCPIPEKGREDTVNAIKETMCYVAPDYDKEMEKAANTKDGDKTYKCTDGSTVTLGNELFRCPEALFLQSLIGQQSSGIHKDIMNAIMKCDIDIRKELFGNIVLSGGNTLFQGFKERLQKEIAALAPPGVKIRIRAPTDRAHSVWIGGSLLASLDSNKPMWITKKMYEEHGPSAAHRK